MKAAKSVRLEVASLHPASIAQAAIMASTRRRRARPAALNRRAAVAAWDSSKAITPPARKLRTRRTSAAVTGPHRNSYHATDGAKSRSPFRSHVATALASVEPEISEQTS